jgi:polyhydroxybutyrate depolymerase
MVTMAPKTLLSTALACAVGLAACGGSSSSGAAATSTASATSTATATATTRCRPTIAPGTHTERFAIGGRTRTVIVHVPRGNPAGARPLVVDLHGSDSNAAQQEIFSGMDATADADDFVVAYPQAVIAQGAGFVWNIPGVPLLGNQAVPAGAANDVAFVTTVVAKLHALACIDLTRVDATGFSGGARLASQLACDASSTFAAVAPVSGLRLPAPCPATRVVPVMAFHGTADPVDPYDGNGQPYWTYSVPVAAQGWAAHDGCAARPMTTHVARTVTLTAYTGCRKGATVALYTIDGEGHEWPGGPPLAAAETRVLGPQSRAIDANALMWRFFVGHPLPAAGS